jgi:hypothetical protein
MRWKQAFEGLWKRIQDGKKESAKVLNQECVQALQN